LPIRVSVRERTDATGCEVRSAMPPQARLARRSHTRR
jgi:hypothetical protein